MPKTTSHLKRLNWFDKIMMAVTFAEADDHQYALKVLDADKKERVTERKRKRSTSRQKYTDIRPQMRI